MKKLTLKKEVVSIIKNEMAEFKGGMGTINLIPHDTEYAPNCFTWAGCPNTLDDCISVYDDCISLVWC